jgi:hypothetical protein
LLEGRRVYRHHIEVVHRDGSVIKLTLEGKNPERVSQLANALRKRYAPKPGQKPPEATQDDWDKFADMLREDRDAGDR